MANLIGTTNAPDTAGVLGESEKYAGVKGVSAAPDQPGVAGANPAGPGVSGESATSYGVLAKSRESAGVFAESVKSTGVYGHSYEGFGVHGESTKTSGVVGVSRAWFGVYGESKDQEPIVFGQPFDKVDLNMEMHHLGALLDDDSIAKGAEEFDPNAGPAYRLHALPPQAQQLMMLKQPKRGRGIGIGVVGKSGTGRGVLGESVSNTAVEGNSKSGIGVYGSSESFEGMHAVTNSLRTAAIAAYNDNPFGTGAAIYARKAGHEGVAGFFEGGVFVTGDVHVRGNITADRDICCMGADFAEDFNIADEAEPGTVMILGEGDHLETSNAAYDTRVAGVISGAGNYRPGIILDKQSADKTRKPVALVGKVFCKADARYGPIAKGDLLTTSATPGHAMKAVDPLRAFGAVIGKALQGLSDGQGLIPVLVALR
ncbi:hypothetical protein EGT74_13490 [Chitinophaga lutea]|uniref:Uncharacterized protein n=1 Tax=Chitinophaga lutea TaxID=2488634 RepID=A0A3N4PN55_9BACT|nr:hypothetical protein [Chitinophaga lutea]RPE08079.1 hypothetical protein EGT74_13490 [Chitinophaga lutea]